MPMAPLAALLLFVAPALAHRPALRPTKLSADYSFAQFAQDYGRRYAAGTAEYRERAALFDDSLRRIRAVNLKNAREGRSWIAGVHPFMDWTPKERRTLQGYKPTRHQQRARGSMAGLQVDTMGRSRHKLNASFVDDAFVGQGARHRNQGNCGSCWAISAAEAVESQLKRAGHDVSVSAQALVDCVPNPQHCGGTGGCDGATGELAYAFMQQHGIPLEDDLPYRASTGICQMGPAAGSYPSQKRVTVSGWQNLPSNEGAGLMQALVNEGSAVVAVDGNDWFDYSTGVYDGCSKDADLGHAVLAKGYGTDAASGKNYWLIQNSWGVGWGENGDIRLLRHDRDDEWCGTDSKPQDGVGCDGGPPTVEVCGMCGVLYDPLVPKDPQIVDDEAVGSLARTSKGDYTPWIP